jgi:4-amino-4-deoxy-L-arabinose transferase-like glycosyltransferase
MAVLALFLFLGSRGLNEPDEGRYAELGREMAVSGDWLVPHLNGFPHFQKPPLLYWLTALSLRVFGVNEWAARLPSALAALATVLAVWLLGRRLLGPARGEAAALVLLSSLEFFALARTLTLDMALTACVTAAVAAFVFRRTWLFFVLMGVGFLTKGPLALVIPCCAALGWQYVARRRGEAQPIPWLRGVVLALAIGLSWFVVLSIRRPELFEYFWRYELVQRFASHAHGRSKPIWFFIPVLIIGFLPWTPWAVAGLRGAWRRLRERNLEPAQALLLAWVIPPLLILSLSGSKLLTYVLPLLPAMALAVAARLRTPERAWRIALPALIVWVAAAGAMPLVEDRFAQQASVRVLARQLAAQPDAATAQVFACEVRAHGFEFALGRLVSVTRSEADIVLPTSAADDARLFESPGDCERHFAQAERSYGLIRTARFGKTFPPERWTVLGRHGDFLLVVNTPSPATPPP